MIMSRSDGGDDTFPHFRAGLGIRRKKLHTNEGDCDAIVGANANQDHVFSGEHTHFQETSPLIGDRDLHRSTLLRI